jgi:hypothetical protein
VLARFVDIGGKHLSLQITGHKKTTIYDVGNPYPDLGRAKTCVRVVHGFDTFISVILIVDSFLLYTL